MPWQTRLPLAALTTLLIGFVLVPVAANLFKAHMGHTLYNIGWVAGIVGTVIVAVYKGYGFVPDPVFIWTTGNNRLLGRSWRGCSRPRHGLGLWLDRQALSKLGYLMRLTGRSPTDFVGPGRHRAGVVEHEPDRRHRHGLRAGRGR